MGLPPEIASLFEEFLHSFGANDANRAAGLVVRGGTRRHMGDITGFDMQASCDGETTGSRLRRR